MSTNYLHSDHMRDNENDKKSNQRMNKLAGLDWITFQLLR